MWAAGKTESSSSISIYHGISAAFMASPRVVDATSGSEMLWVAQHHQHRLVRYSCCSVASACFCRMNQRPDVRHPPGHPRCFDPPSGSEMQRMACRGDHQGSGTRVCGGWKAGLSNHARNRRPRKICGVGEVSRARIWALIRLLTHPPPIDARLERSDGSEIQGAMMAGHQAMDE